MTKSDKFRQIINRRTQQKLKNKKQGKRLAERETAKNIWNKMEKEKTNINSCFTKNRERERRKK